MGWLRWLIPALLTRMSRTAERRERFLDAAGHVRSFRHVGRDGERALPDFAGRALDGFPVEIDQRHLRALAREGGGDSKPEADPRP